MKKSFYTSVAAALVTLLSLPLSAEVVTLKSNSHGKLSLETAAPRIGSYRPLVLCDSENLNVSVFMSEVKNGKMITEVWYKSKEASSAECHLVYTQNVEDNLIDLESSEPISIKPGITTFKINN